MKKKDWIIVILIVVILGLTSYLIFSEINREKEVTGGTNSSNNVESSNKIEEKDAEFFDDYLSMIVKFSHFHDIERFDNEKINLFLNIAYVFEKIDKKNCTSIETCTHNVSKTEIDNLVYKYFNNRNFEPISYDKMGIRLLDENTYQFYWTPTEIFQVKYQNRGVKYDGKNVTVKYYVENPYVLLDSTNPNSYYHGELTVYLTYSNGRYIVNKTSFNKA